MPHPLPKAVRERCVRYVEAGNSCHEAARKYDVSPSFVINLMKLWRETGSVEPRPRGGYRRTSTGRSSSAKWSAGATSPCRSWRRFWPGDVVIMDNLAAHRAPGPKP